MLHKDRVIYSFSTTAEAMKMEKVCLSLSAPGGIIPLPSAIAAGCGLAWAADSDKADILDEIIKTNNLTVSGRTILFL